MFGGFDVKPLPAQECVMYGVAIKLATIKHQSEEAGSRATNNFENG